MQPDHRARYTFGFALLAALLAALILWNLNTGSLHLSWFRSPGTRNLPVAET